MYKMFLNEEILFRICCIGIDLWANPAINMHLVAHEKAIITAKLREGWSRPILCLIIQDYNGWVMYAFVYSLDDVHGWTGHFSVPTGIEY